jgi:hypothetical protein
MGKKLPESDNLKGKQTNKFLPNQNKIGILERTSPRKAIFPNGVV